MIQIVSDNAEAILERFHQHLTAHGNLSDGVMGSYIAAVRNFASWYESYTGQSFHLRNVSTPALIPYKLSLQERGMEPLAVKRHITMLTRLFAWAATTTPHSPKQL
jgi:site-specific recombinase XerD